MTDLAYRRATESDLPFIVHLMAIDDVGDIKLDDPKAMTEPMQTSLTYKLYDHDHMDEDFCVENNRNRPDANLRVQVDLEPHKQYGFDLPD